MRIKNTIATLMCIAGTLLRTAAIGALICIAMPGHQAGAQNIDQFSRSYLTPFPEDDRYNLYVFGDSLGEGLWTGVQDALKEDTRFQVFRKIHYGAALARAKGQDWAAIAEDILRNEKVHIAVIFIGAAERLTIWTKGKKYPVGSEEWRAIVAQRVDRLIKRLQRERAAIYWVGLPVMRSPSVNGDMQALNEVFRERAFLNGAKFIDTWNAFADQFGRYSPFGPDMTGSVKRLRSDDGIHFTFRGNQKLAHFVQKEILKDLALARAERNIPLAGNEQEQNRVRRKPAKKTAAKPAQKDKGGKKKTKGSGGWFSLVKEKKADSPDITTIGKIQILRPRLNDATLGGFSNTSRRSAANAFVGEQVAKDTAGDLTAIGSISSVNTISLRAIKQRVPLAQTPYYKVLIKGEPQKPKPGRADDFAWPAGAESPKKAGS